MRYGQERLVATPDSRSPFVCISIDFVDGYWLKIANNIDLIEWIISLIGRVRPGAPICGERDDRTTSICPAWPCAARLAERAPPLFLCWLSRRRAHALGPPARLERRQHRAELGVRTDPAPGTGKIGSESRREKV